LSVTVFPAQGSARSENIECKGTSCTYALKLDEACRLTVTWSPAGDWESEVRRSFKVDPQREKSLRVEMGGDALRTIEFRVHGAAIPSQGMLGFGKLDSIGLTGHETTSTSVTDGHVHGQVSLSPGRWFFECFDAKRDFNVTGVVEVKAGSDVVQITRDVVTVETAEIPHGIEFTELDGVKLDGLAQPIRYTELGPSGKVVLNATARYTVLP
jgi:hypothetical protein